MVGWEFKELSPIKEQINGHPIIILFLNARYVCEPRKRGSKTVIF